MIREAVLNDASRIAEIEVLSSRFAYQKILPEECLKDLTAESRVPVIARWITEKRFGIYVYEDSATGILLGMMGTGMCGDEDRQGAFELHFLYVDPEYLRKGIGSEMLRFFERQGMERGCRERVIWVLEENGIGISFYEKNGYRPDGGEKIFRRWNKKEIRYVKE